MGYVDTKMMTEFSDSVSFPFSSSIGEKDIRNLLFFKDFQGICTCGNCVGAKHEDAIDIKGERIIERRTTCMRGAFGRMLKMSDGIATVSPSRSKGRCT
jgi:hypothetical protein